MHTGPTLNVLSPCSAPWVGGWTCSVRSTFAALGGNCRPCLPPTRPSRVTPSTTREHASESYALISSHPLRLCLSCPRSITPQVEWCALERASARVRLRVTTGCCRVRFTQAALTLACPLGCAASPMNSSHRTTLARYLAIRTAGVLGSSHRTVLVPRSG